MEQNIKKTKIYNLLSTIWHSGNVVCHINEVMYSASSPVSYGMSDHLGRADHVGIFYRLPRLTEHPTLCRT